MSVLHKLEFNGILTFSEDDAIIVYGYFIHNHKKMEIAKRNRSIRGVISIVVYFEGS